MAAIGISNVAKRFGSYAALIDIDLDVADREFLVLLGASGCGKTTLLRLIAGLDTPSEGDIMIGGKRVNDLPPRSRGIAMVFQNYAVFPHLTVFENIAFGLRMKKKLNEADLTAKVQRSASLMHIEQLLHRYSGQLSGGQRQRVAVARALAMEPEVLLMDEPLSNLDALLRLEMRAELKGVLQESRTTTIYVTHDQVEAMSLGDRIAVMHQGRIVQAAAPIDVYRDPATQFVGGFIGSPPMNFLPAKRRDGKWSVAGIDVAGPGFGGETITFAIRPEDLIPGDGGLAGAVRVVEPLGAHQLVTMTVAETLFRAVLDSDLPIKPGDRLMLRPRPERIRWFDPDGVAISRLTTRQIMTAEISTKTLLADAQAILNENDRGAYTVPTKGLYPFQWNWDFCLTALGQRHFDERRAWVEVETLLAHQWPDGMVPHIVFHEQDDGYFPGPDVWATGRPVPTSGITQPPVLGYVLEQLFSEARDPVLAREKALQLVPKADAWHRWFYTNRDPGRTGLVAILHPWEAGRDNSIDWDEPLRNVPAEGVAPYRRRDTQHVNAAERPTQAEYDRYMWLVGRFRSIDWDNTKLHAASPFQVVDPGFNAILIRSDEALGRLAEAIGLTGIAAAAKARAARARPAMARLWSDPAGQFLCLDRTTGRLIESHSVGGLLPLFAGLGDTARMVGTIRRWRSAAAFGVPSHDPADPRFDSRRYWRGPVWLIVNHLIADGLKRSGHAEAAAEISADSLALIRRSGFAEYYDPLDGAALGGRRFTWTAAMVVELLGDRE